MPLAQISILEGRSPEMVAQMAEAVTDAIAGALSTPHDRIRVVVTEIPAGKWFVAGQSMAQRAGGGVAQNQAGAPDAANG